MFGVRTKIIFNKKGGKLQVTHTQTTVFLPELLGICIVIEFRALAYPTTPHYIAAMDDENTGADAA